ncbi:MAG: RagB/SusD family nutrient uptake outer membrane protein [Chlorobi bacterium]|nr:RagB/SusD family nutrient uptake outer membrane protein [Chlorobiota bacterium]
MTWKKKIFISGILGAAFLFMVSCINLDVDPPFPDTQNIYGTTQEMIDAAGLLYRNWYNAAHALKGPALGLAAAADQITSLKSNAGIRDLAKEPRVAFNNITDYSYLYITKNFWTDMYRVSLTANDILRVIQNKDRVLQTNGVDAKPMLQAWAYFIRGIGYGYLGLLFDQATVIDVNTPLPVKNFSDYHEVIDFALASLDSAIVISQRNSFTLPESYIRGYQLTSSDLAAIASGYAARILISAPRNDLDNLRNDWQKIKDYAIAAWTQDLAPDTDNDNWKDEYKRNGAYPEWAYTDLRIIHLLDNHFPARWPEDNVSWDTDSGTEPDSSYLHSDDARATTDFAWVKKLKPENPFYLNSFYRYKRYDNWLSYSAGPSPELTVTETNLILAEAETMLNNLSEAITIINNGTRTQRGQLSPIDAGADKITILNAIFYERDIELMFTGAGTSFFDMRRRDMLQTGTPLHFPVPAGDLEILEMDIYTFGGVENADGINTSNGGWF